MCISLQVQMEQQDPDQLLQHEMDQKKAMQQLSGAVHCLESKLDTIMTEQSRSWNSWRITSKVDAASSEPTQANSYAAVQIHNTAVQCQNAVGPSSVLKVGCISELQQAVSQSDSTGHTKGQKEQLGCSSQQVSTLHQAGITESSAQGNLQACPSSTTSSCTPDTGQHISSPAYRHWLKVVAAVEAASVQLKDQAVERSEAFTSYAGLLQSRLHSDVQ